jgi:hypothetical protein
LFLSIVGFAVSLFESSDAVIIELLLMPSIVVFSVSVLSSAVVKVV